MVEYILQYFKTDGLTPAEKAVAVHFSDLAHLLCSQDTGIQASPERSLALRRLLDARDAAIRAVNYSS